MVSIGNIEIHGTYLVKELDAGHDVSPNTYISQSGNVAFSHETLREIETQLAIVIPCMNEDNPILDGVLRGVPHDCLIIVISNSRPENFQREVDLLNLFRKDTGRAGIIVHQPDTSLGDAFIAAGAKDLVGMSNGEFRVKNGKGEGMMIGVVMAKLMGKKYVGFIDADNRVPGSVHEYCKIFAAGLHHATNVQQGQQVTGTNGADSIAKPHAMVRIKWNSKPKIKDGQLDFTTSGRCSRVVNTWMNHFLGVILAHAVSKDIIETSNAGEHAMDIDLALQLRFGTSYAVEPFQLIDLLERSGYHFPAKFTECPANTFSRKVRVLQIATRNPHIHDFGKGEDHIHEMQTKGLSTIYHSTLTPEGLKADMKETMAANFGSKTRSTRRALVDPTGMLVESRPYNSMNSLDFIAFKGFIDNLDVNEKIYR